MGWRCVILSRCVRHFITRALYFYFQAVLNRYGFNSEGVGVVHERVRAIYAPDSDVPLGVNLGITLLFLFLSVKCVLILKFLLLSAVKYLMRVKNVIFENIFCSKLSKYFCRRFRQE